MMISEEQTWSIARTFADEAAALFDHHLKAVVVVGSLAGGSYRPGRSDIDTILIADDQCPQSVRQQLRTLRDRLRMEYGVPKDLGGIIIREEQLFPPYDPAEELAPELLRLKQQGVVIWGNYDLSQVPEPSAADFLAYARVFYPWLRTLIDQRPSEYRTVEATVNTILYELRLFIWHRTGAYVFDKR